VTLLCLAFFAGPTIPQQEMVMPDGTMFRLMGITYGTNHILDDRSLLKRMLSQVPANWLSNVSINAGSPIDQRSSETTALGIWLRVEDGDVSAPPYGFAFLTDPDEHMHCSTYRDGTSHYGKEICICLFEDFPRRSKNVLLTLYSNAGKRKFKVENPYYGRKYPTWKGQPLPLTLKRGDVEITLSKLTTYEARQTMAEIEIRQHGQLFTNWVMGLENPTSADWDLSGMWVEDATGNKITAFGEREIFKDGRSTLFFQDCLDPSESAWKFGLTYSKCGSHTPEETWTVPLACTNIFLIDHYSFESNRVIARTNLLGVDIELAGLRWPSENLRTYSAQLKVCAHKPLYRAGLVSVTDAQGRPLTIECKELIAGYATEYWFLGEDTNTFNITVALSPCGTVEFLAKPSPPELRSK
jgi:hypothetical protein